MGQHSRCRSGELSSPSQYPRLSRTKFGPLVLSGGSKFLVPTYLTAWLLGILRRDECHRLEPLSGREERHDDHLQDRDGSVEGVRLE